MLKKPLLPKKPLLLKKKLLLLKKLPRLKKKPLALLQNVKRTDAFGCAVIPAGDTIKVGMGAPLLGDYSMFGIDISQGVEVALVQDDGFEGWKLRIGS